VLSSRATPCGYGKDENKEKGGTTKLSLLNTKLFLSSARGGEKERKPNASSLDPSQKTEPTPCFKGKKKRKGMTIRRSCSLSSQKGDYEPASKRKRGERGGGGLCLENLFSPCKAPPLGYPQEKELGEEKGKGRSRRGRSFCLLIRFSGKGEKTRQQQHRSSPRKKEEGGGGGQTIPVPIQLNLPLFKLCAAKKKKRKKKGKKKKGRGMRCLQCSSHPGGKGSPTPGPRKRKRGKEREKRNEGY